MSTGAAFLAQCLQKNAVVIFATRTCPFCRRAAAILSKVTSDIGTYYIDSIKEGDDVYDEIVARFDHRTVPAIFVRGKFVGGCDDMEDLKASGKLERMLQAK